MLPEAKWFALEQRELFNGEPLSKAVYLDKCLALDNYTDNTRPGFVHMIAGRKNYSARYIFTELCDQPRRGRKDMRNFIKDVLNLIQNGHLPRN